jgi:hypothetical protein
VIGAPTKAPADAGASRAAATNEIAVFRIAPSTQRRGSDQ